MINAKSVLFLKKQQQQKLIQQTNIKKYLTKKKSKIKYELKELLKKHKNQHLRQRYIFVYVV